MVMLIAVLASGGVPGPVVAQTKEVVVLAVADKNVDAAAWPLAEARRLASAVPLDDKRPPR